ncbi:hypothetical protein SELMODRAFT_417285 [Selaginella moellendorffii]|uniref:Protein kinase domain-containing protein n=1 Tax=Selaginella moellendorffii TaxID=88036 RepID=D8S2Q5_SELML|nr:hypothetical protein SELMODRAFT_417285 [Selaginella moellendorffii]
MSSRPPKCGKHLLGSVEGPKFRTRSESEQLLNPVSSTADRDSSAKKRRTIRSDAPGAYMVMTVRLLAVREPVSEDELRQMVLGIRKALKALHGLVHRDIRPANVLRVHSRDRKCWDEQWGIPWYGYTTRSDLYPVGLLMHKHYPRLLTSQALQALVKGLLGKSYNTVEGSYEEDSPLSSYIPSNQQRQRRNREELPGSHEALQAAQEYQQHLAKKSRSTIKVLNQCCVSGTYVMVSEEQARDSSFELLQEDDAARESRGDRPRPEWSPMEDEMELDDAASDWCRVESLLRPSRTRQGRRPRLPKGELLLRDDHVPRRDIQAPQAGQIQ